MLHCVQQLVSNSVWLLFAAVQVDYSEVFFQCCLLRLNSKVVELTAKQ